MATVSCMCVLRPLLSCQPHIEVGFIDIFSLVKIYTRDNFENALYAGMLMNVLTLKNSLLKYSCFSSDFRVNLFIDFIPA